MPLSFAGHRHDRRTRHRGWFCRALSHRDMKRAVVLFVAVGWVQFIPVFTVSGSLDIQRLAAR